LKPPVAEKRNSTHSAFSPIEGASLVRRSKPSEYCSNDMRPVESKAALFILH
jgi:hypothetical protein